MGGGIGYSSFAATGLISLGSYNLIASIYTFLKTPSAAAYSAKPYHPFAAAAAASSSTRTTVGSALKQQGGLYLVIAWLVIAIIHEGISALDADPLLKGHTPVHLFTSLRSSAVLLLFLLLPLSLLLLPSLDLRLFFSLLSASLFLQSSTSSSSASLQTSLLQAHLSSASSRVSAISAGLALSLAFNPRFFPAEVGLWGSVLLQGLWTLQTGLSLYIDAFIPDGCHRLLDVAPGVDGSTRCDLDDSNLRAIAILDLLFVAYVLLVFLFLITVYALAAKAAGAGASGGGGGGVYEALPTSDSTNNISQSIQMKTLTGTQA